MKRSRSLSRRTAILLLAVAAIGGCERTTRLREVSGNVTLGGHPLDHGTIQFVRYGDQAQPVGGAAIQDGRYTLPASHGLDPGRYKVLITSPETGPAPAGDPMRAVKPVNKERIPAEFNTQSEAFVEVGIDGPNQFDFAIP